MSSGSNSNSPARSPHGPPPKSPSRSPNPLKFKSRSKNSLKSNSTSSLALSKNSNHSSSGSFDGDCRDATYNVFLEAFPKWKDTNEKFENLIKEEYSRLGDLVYLDYTGSTLYSKTQIERHRQFLMKEICGNEAAVIEAKTRADILSYFKADPEEYTIIFTPNATGAIKTVGENFPFGKKKPLLILYDNHTSIVGLREYAASKKASFDWVQIDDQTGFAVDSELKKKLEVKEPGLFCFPAQSNWSGVQHSLEFIELAQKAGWYVMVDCAAFAPTNELDLRKWKPDFVPISFYKIFGYPTGIGCLIAKKKSLSILDRPLVPGVSVVVRANHHEAFRPDSHHHWEEGTPNLYHLNAISVGFDWILGIGVADIHNRTVILAEWLYHELDKLQFPNGNPLVSLYGTTDFTKRGGTVTFNVRTHKRKFVPKDIIEQQALTSKICIRGGCFCNPGSSETLIGVLGVTFDICLGIRAINGKICPKDVVLCAQDQPVGALRISFGIASRWEDAYALLGFMTRFLDTAAVKQWKKEWKALRTIPGSLC